MGKDKKIRGPAENGPLPEFHYDCVPLSEINISLDRNEVKE